METDINVIAFDYLDSDDDFESTAAGKESVNNVVHTTRRSRKPQLARRTAPKNPIAA